MSNFFKQQPLILASASESRRQLLASLGLDFEVIPANCDEDLLKRDFGCSDSFSDLGMMLARSKALDVSQRYPEHFVIAADQLCILGDRLFDKPMTHATAVTHLQILRGQTHQQIAAWCIAKAGQILWQEQDTAFLKMHLLRDETIEAYLRQDEPYQSCGAYHYEGQAKWLFEDVRGSDSTIMGLPLGQVTKALIELGAVTV